MAVNATTTNESPPPPGTPWVPSPLWSMGRNSTGEGRVGGIFVGDQGCELR
jgi:hypothetical protein